MVQGALFPMNRFVLACGFVFAAATATAAPLRRDLGGGLDYLRVHTLPGELPGEFVQGRRGCVLDIRYVKGGAADAAALTSWIKGHAGAKTPVILLANAETSRDLLTPFANANSVRGLIVIGPDASGYPSDLAVAQSAARERKAYEALEKGTPLAKLLDDNPPKERNDEARLEKEHLSDADMEADQAAEVEKDRASKNPRPLVDRPLQRAVQVYQALVALKRV
jgi:hypothetical protein